jgi:hypothetical protein
MKKILILLIALISSDAFCNSYGGEIRYRWLSGSTYDITIIIYDQTGSNSADRPILDSINAGDGTIISAPRQSMVNLPGDISISTYGVTHTYPGNGIYTIYCSVSNYISNINNFPNSSDKPVVLVATLFISPNIYPGNSSPIFLNPPVFYWSCCDPFQYNLNAQDTAVDSLTYSLSAYDSSHSLTGATIDSRTGDFIFYPPTVGKYLFIYRVTEWRSMAIATSMRAIVITVESTTGIEEYDPLDLFSLMPNPTTGNFKIKIGSPQETNFEVAIFDLTGRQLMEKIIYTSEESFFDIFFLPAGVYLIQVNSDKNSKTKKLVKLN